MRSLWGPGLWGWEAAKQPPGGFTAVATAVGGLGSRGRGAFKSNVVIRMGEAGGRGGEGGRDKSSRGSYLFWVFVGVIFGGSAILIFVRL